MVFRHLWLLSIFTIFCTSPALAQELGSGGRASGESQDSIRSRAQNTKQTEKTDECGPIEDTSSLLSYGQTAAVCSPGVLALGAKGLQKIAPVPAKKIISKITQKAATRIGAYAVGGAGVLWTLYDVGSFIASIKPSACDNDLELKKALVERSNQIGESIISAVGESSLNQYVKDKLKHLPTLASKSCNAIYREIREKKKYQERMWLRARLNNNISSEKRARLEKKKSTFTIKI